MLVRHRRSQKTETCWATEPPAEGAVRPTPPVTKRRRDREEANTYSERERGLRRLRCALCRLRRELFQDLAGPGRVKRNTDAAAAGPGRTLLASLK